MPGRMMTPGSFRWLEWGMDSRTPRSRVFDRAGNMMFTGSLVRWATGPEPMVWMRVTELAEHHAVIVSQHGDGAPREVPHGELVLVHALPRRADLPEILSLDLLL